MTGIARITNLDDINGLDFRSEFVPDEIRISESGDLKVFRTDEGGDGGILYENPTSWWEQIISLHPSDYIIQIADRVIP